jgi:hypothetical protein
MTDETEKDFLANKTFASSYKKCVVAKLLHVEKSSSHLARDI